MQLYFPLTFSFSFVHSYSIFILPILPTKWNSMTSPMTALFHCHNCGLVAAEEEEEISEVKHEMLEYRGG